MGAEKDVFVRQFGSPELGDDVELGHLAEVLGLDVHPNAGALVLLGHPEDHAVVLAAQVHGRDIPGGGAEDLVHTPSAGPG